MSVRSRGPAAPPARVAVVVRGEVFRGLNFDVHLSRDAADRRTDALRRRLPCLNSSYAVQRALALIEGVGLG